MEIFILSLNHYTIAMNAANKLELVKVEKIAKISRIDIDQAMLYEPRRSMEVD